MKQYSGIITKERSAVKNSKLTKKQITYLLEIPTQIFDDPSHQKTKSIYKLKI